MKETIAWECAHCRMRRTKGELARIGRDAWALTNPREA